MFKRRAETNKGSLVDDGGKLILRVSIAGLMLFHGVAKITGGVGGVQAMLTDAGLPTVLAYGVYVGEVVAPVLMILGFFARTAAIVFAFNMLVAIFLGHPNELLSIGEFGQWMIELPVLYLVGGVCVAIFGPGRFAIRRGGDRE